MNPSTFRGVVCGPAGVILDPAAVADPRRPRNLISFRACPPVICQRRGPAFRWHDGAAWKQGDALPLIIITASPPSERRRFRSHAAARGVEVVHA